MHDSTGSGLKNYSLSLVLTGAGDAAVVERADGEQGQPDVVNQRHAIPGSTFWPTARWTPLALRVALDKKELVFKAGGNELMRANLQSPSSNLATTVRVGVVSELNPAGNWVVHHDNVYLRFAR